MVKYIDRIRLPIARCLLVLMSGIVVSGVLFMHKHTTRDGQIVMHIHPYDFTDSQSESDHHRSDDEIYYLNVLFTGNYLESNPTSVHLPAARVLLSEESLYVDSYHPTGGHAHFFLRGPPSAGAVPA